MKTSNHHHFDELLFLDVMIDHYAALYSSMMFGWRFKKAAFAWKRLQYYKGLRIEIQQQVMSLLKELNIQQSWSSRLNIPWMMLYGSYVTATSIVNRYSGLMQ